jgi:hypothetical protein
VSASRLTELLEAYARHVSTPWQRGLAGSQRLLFAIYDKTLERRLRAQVDEFQMATERAGHGWQLIDLTDAFPQWMAEVRYRDSYFEAPDLLEGYVNGEVEGFVRDLAARLKTEVAEADEDTVVALLGVGALFGLARVSRVVNEVAPAVRGRLLVFFPGEHERRTNTYRLLDARDGWNYLAVPIPA